MRDVGGQSDGCGCQPAVRVLSFATSREAAGHEAIFGHHRGHRVSRRNAENSAGLVMGLWGICSARFRAVFLCFDIRDCGWGGLLPSLFLGAGVRCGLGEVLCWTGR